MRGYGGGGGWREMPTKYSNKLRSETEREKKYQAILFDLLYLWKI
jgi:hypothetical protein